MNGNPQKFINTLARYASYQIGLAADKSKIWTCQNQFPCILRFFNIRYLKNNANLSYSI